MASPSQTRSITGGLEGALADIDTGAEATVAEIARLIEIDTSFPPGAGYRVFCEVMRTMLRPLGLNSEEVIVPPHLWDDQAGVARRERVNLIARRLGERHEPCSIYFHVDTVPPGDGWTRHCR